MRRYAILGAVALACTACASWDSSVRARERASEVLHCGEIELESRGESAWRATGCGASIDVACSTAGNEPDCIPVRMRTAGGAAPNEGARVAARDDAAADDEAADDEAADGDENLETHTDAEQQAVADATQSSATGAASSTEAGASAAAPLRAILDARREDVLACASRERLVVRATWDAEGAVALALGGDLAGSPEEGCVAALFSDVRAPRGAPGMLLHLLRLGARAAGASPD